ncbi:hypothetical protein XELAEV_18026317mg [Xenopus laevis]|uniref:Uncharacterized protein n=1 Tax=Xenopus laevis TaxID=8355 RepID=A0A974CVF5_XENLA|nr:hypothetical protein XELAEV_18026317mg [Xenopus laevis]
MVTSILITCPVGTRNMKGGCPKDLVCRDQGFRSILCLQWRDLGEISAVYPGWSRDFGNEHCLHWRSQLLVLEG